MKVTKLRELTLGTPSGPGRRPHLSAASGLVRAGDSLYVVPDDEQHLGVFPATGNAPGALIRMLAGELPATNPERKARKADLEVLTRLPPFPGCPSGALLALGSGSRPTRRRGALLSLDARGAVIGASRSIDFAGVFDSLEHELPAVNIEGAVIVADRLRLLHRGTKRHPQSAWIDLHCPDVLRALGSSDAVDTATLVGTAFFDLGTINGIPLAFTDGAPLPDDTVVFTAVAEDTEDGYEDGSSVGAAVGIADRSGRVRVLEQLEVNLKIEGIEAQLEGDVIRLLLVTDADEERLPASLLAATIHGYR